MRAIGLGLLSAMAVSLGVAPAVAAGPVDPEATVVEELVVASHAGGPAWWTVSRGESRVWIMGIPGALPKDVKWDQTLMRRRLKGANSLIVPPVLTAGFGDLFAILAAQRHFRSTGPMEDALDAPLRARFLAAKPKLNKDPKAYSGWKPLPASLFMLQDFRKQNQLEGRQPTQSVEALARDLGVKITPAGRYRAVPFLRAAEELSPAGGAACLTDALDEIDAGSRQVRIAAQGWARGDVAAALTAQRGYEKCLNSLPDGADIAEKAMADTATTVGEALKTPGYSVAVVNLRTLLAENGVLRRLKAQGFKVSTPGE